MRKYVDTLPVEITPGTKALFHDPAGARARDGNEWCPVILTGEQGTFRDGSRWVEIETSSGRGRDLDAKHMRLVEDEDYASTPHPSAHYEQP